MVEVVVSATVVSAEPPYRKRVAAAKALQYAQQVSLAVAQIAVFWLLNVGGTRLVEATALPIPGNLVGMAVLYALLALGLVRVTWFEPSGSFLTKHLAFFFIPITVGLMDTGGLFLRQGVAILATLALSAAVGIFLAGRVSQLILR